MKTLTELFREVIGSGELKKSYFEAAKAGKTEEFLSSHDCAATREELDAFLSNSKSLPMGEIADDELDAVAGGTCYTDGRPVVSALNCCLLWTCDICHKQGSTVFEVSSCMDDHNAAYCYNCDYCRYESGLWVCYHPDRHNEEHAPQEQNWYFGS